MTIRLKLLLLLLLFSTATLLSITLISQLTFYRSGIHLAEETERTLADQAHRTLRGLVENFQGRQNDDQRILEFALTRSQRQGGRSRYADSSRLADPPAAYATLESYRPGTVSRQLTVFEAGRTLIYPPVENLSAGMDLRQQPWYRDVRARQEITRALAIDPGSGSQAFIVAGPLLDENGQFLGATALVRPLWTIFAELQLTDSWREAAREMLVAKVPGSATEAAGLRILAVRDNGDGDRPWEQLRVGELLRPDRAEDHRRLLEQIATGRGGTLRLNLRGESAHWIFSASPTAAPFALVLVPHERVIAHATAAKQHVVDETIRGLKLAGALLGITVLAVFFTATLASKKVTQPLDRLASAAKRLAAGDFGTRVEIQTGDEIEALGQVFNRLGPALAERERMASSLALAGDIQSHLLPQEQPQVNGFEIFGGALSCDETGGDYFDFIPLKENHLALVVGDVSGHGIGAALLMAGARGVLRSHAPRRDFNLSLLFAALNKHLCRDTADEQFMTMFYGVLSDCDRTLHWCSAGHGPFFLYRGREQNISELGSTGLPLGIIDDAAWEEGDPVVFASGDILLVGTDGIWEARNPRGEVLGTERLKTQLRSHAEKPAAQIHAAIMELVRDFRDDSRQEDDITLSVVKAI